MSQQLDGSAIKQVQDLVLSGYYMEDIQRLACPTAVLPAGTGIESLERFSSERFRFRGAMETTSIDDFVFSRSSLVAAMMRKLKLLSVLSHKGRSPRSCMGRSNIC